MDILAWFYFLFLFLDSVRPEQRVRNISWHSLMVVTSGHLFGGDRPVQSIGGVALCPLGALGVVWACFDHGCGTCFVEGLSPPGAL